MGLLLLAFPKTNHIECRWWCGLDLLLQGYAISFVNDIFYELVKEKSPSLDHLIKNQVFP